MSDPFVGEIRVFGFSYPPQGWAICAGQLLPISQNTALFSILGTSFGGDGRSTFALPNLQGIVPVHVGAGPGLTPRTLGEAGGTPEVTLSAAEMPAHSYAANCNSGPGTSYGPATNVWASDAGWGERICIGRKYSNGAQRPHTGGRRSTS
jgi:microcystin-dependent protein